MHPATFSATFLLILHIFAAVAVIIRVLLHPHRQAASRIAWIVIVLSIPFVGVVAYLLLGETNIGKKRVLRMKEVISRLPDAADIPLKTDDPNMQVEVPKRCAHLFRAGETVNGFQPVGGNRAKLMKDSNVGIDSIVADIDSAQEHVHLLFYIWLCDNNGLKVAQALKRAASRGVICRAMADDLGSRVMIASEHWKSMGAAGVKLGRALPIGNILLKPLQGRIDLRNHRKIVVIDNKITYCGSQNCADPEFLVKAKYAPWVDALMRFEGPVVRQNQYLFASDWESETGEDISPLLTESLSAVEPGFPAQVIGTGPTVRYSAMPEIFETLIYAARNELVISTPYYVPDEPMQTALCACARRGVKAIIIFPARNDSWIVAAASRSYYDDLMTAGVEIHEYEGGLLHTKSLTIDGEITLIGSANMDRRSFELNYENNILFYDSALTTDMRERQEQYLSHSKQVTAEIVESWSWKHRLWNNTIAMLGPVL